jgi:hypothetical protein
MLEAGLVRIGVSTACLSTWIEHRARSGLSARMARGLVIAARAQGANPGDWLVHFGPVARERWIAVQRFDGLAWVEAVQS